MTSYFWPKLSILGRLTSSSQEGNKLIMESYFFHIILIISKKENTVPLNTVWTKQWKIISFFTVQSIFPAGTLSKFFPSCLVFECYGFCVAFFSFRTVFCFKRSQRALLCFLDCLSRKFLSAELSSAGRKQNWQEPSSSVAEKNRSTVTVHFWVRRWAKPWSQSCR